MNISERIAKARKEAGLSQTVMAEKLGLKRSTYANWETTITPSIEELKKIANILDIPLNNLIGQSAPDVINKSVYNEKLLSDLMEKYIKVEAKLDVVASIVATIISVQKDTNVAKELLEIDKISDERADRIFAEFSKKLGKS